MPDEMMSDQMMSDDGVPEETESSEDFEFCDFEFSIAKAERSDNGELFVRAEGLHEGREIGFEVRLHADWTEQILEDSGITLYWGGLEWISTGDASDYFLEILDAAYETETGGQKMAERVPFTVAALAGDPLAEELQALKLKLFFEPDEEADEDRYAEVYLNIDLAEGLLEVAEKDPDYRLALVQCLTAGANQV